MTNNSTSIAQKLSIPIRYSLGKNKYDNQPEQRTAANFDEFQNVVLNTRSPTKGLAYVCSALDEGCHDDPQKYPGIASWRLAKLAAPCRFLSQDFDGFSSPEKLTATTEYLKRYKGFAYTTASHRDDAPRARVIIVTNREMTRAERIAVGEALEAEMKKALGEDAIKFDQSVYRSEQPSYTPVTTSKTMRFDGHELEVDVLLAKSAHPAADPHGVQIEGNLQKDSPPETPENIERVNSMLASSSADCGYEQWRNVVWAIASTGWQCAEDLARNWSATAPERFDEAAFNAVWQSYDPGKTNGVGLGTLVYLAKQNGWQDTSVGTAQHAAGSQGDVANGKRFAGMFQNKLLFVHETGEVLLFNDDAGWLSAPPEQEVWAAKQVLAAMHDEAVTQYRAAPEEKKTKYMQEEVKRTSKAPVIRAMIEMAKSEPGMMRELHEFDADPMQLGVANGVLDLQQHVLLPVAPNLLVSKRCTVAYMPGATCPRWVQFMIEVQPDPLVREFIQRWIGYCLTGSVQEQVFVFVHGGGANGKSVFVELVAWLLGDYARKIATEMLMQHQRSPQAASPDIVALKGRRFVHANETAEGRKLDSNRVKEMTGSDTLTGRVPYGKFDVNFAPTHKLMIVGNHKPEITDNGDGMWRKVLLVDFGVTFPVGKRDPKLLEKLKAEGSGILNWALEGLRKWQLGGLAIPQSITAATAAYRDEQDIIGDWVREHCNTGSGMTVKKTEAYKAYRSWALQNGHQPMAQRRLTQRLGERGYPILPDKRTIGGAALNPDGMTAATRL
ncbi:MAG: phage/plasmid primase, P4 family [Pseudomonadota bacterium]